MIRIRKANYFDKQKIKKMISFLNEKVIAHYTSGFTNFPLNAIHDVLPLKLKFLPESYIIEDSGSIIGMVTILPAGGNPYKLEISRLYLEQDYYNIGKQLIDFVVAKYGAKGATTFIATIDDSYDELLHLFVDGCGFRQCSSEQLWKINDLTFTKSENLFFRPFKNSDSSMVASMFNDSVITHFKYSISTTKNEYHDPIFAGLMHDNKFKYIIDGARKQKAYVSISTDDNINFVIDAITPPVFDSSFDNILYFAVNEISKRKKDFNLYVKLKKYTTSSDTLQSYLQSQNASFVQNQQILVKDFYRVIKEPEQAQKVLLFNGIFEKPVFKI